MGDFANYSHLGDNGMTHHFNLPSEEEIREWCDKTFYKDPENPKEFDEANYAAKKAIRWFRDRIKPVERLSDEAREKIARDKYIEWNKSWDGDPSISGSVSMKQCHDIARHTYLCGYDHGYQAAEARILGLKENYNE